MHFLGGEFRPHFQSKIATLFPKFCVCFSQLRKLKKKKIVVFFFIKFMRKQNNFTLDLTFSVCLLSIVLAGDIFLHLENGFD